MPVKLPVTSEIALGCGKGQIVSDLGLTRATHHLGIFPCRVHESEPQNVQVQRCENLNKEVTAKDSENGETQLPALYTLATDLEPGIIRLRDPERSVSTSPVTELVTVNHVDSHFKYGYCNGSS